jgi:hypothetical protein
MAVLIVPPPPPPTVARFNADGTPTKAQVEYEAKVTAFLRKLAAALP